MLENGLYKSRFKNGVFYKGFLYQALLAEKVS